VIQPLRWQFAAADTPNSLRAASDELEAILSSHGASEATRFAARLVCEEIVLNAIEHGGAGFVTLEVEPASAPQHLVFEDDGAEFDPATLADPNGADTPGDLSPRGRGLILVRRFTRAIKHRRAEGRNRLSVLLVE
jgi:anti-sigma regulatory factor (Ser/Thr protein kinase)